MSVAYQIKNRFPSLPVILVSAYAEMPERILWLVDDYVLKSELPEGLVQIVKSQTQVESERKALRSEGREEPGKSSAAVA